MKHIRDLGEFKAKISAGLSEELALSVRKAILLRRSGTAAPVNGPGDSYFGGLPRLPPGLDWPHVELDSLDWGDVPGDFQGERVPMNFAAQVRLDDLPPVPGREQLPAKGVLYFFQLGTYDGRKSIPCRVLFHPVQQSFPERPPPPGLPRLRAYGYQGLPEALWRSVEFRFPMTFMTADTYVDEIELFPIVKQHKPIWVPAEDRIYDASEVAEAILTEARVAALARTLGTPRLRTSDDAARWPEDAQAAQLETRTWLSQLEDIETNELVRVGEDSRLCCYYANVCCEQGRGQLVPRRWIDLLEERVAWVDAGDTDEGLFSWSWSSFEMHQMFGHWKHDHSCVSQHSCAPDDVLLMQVDRSEQLAFSAGTEGVMHYVISAEALRCRDFAQVRLYA